MPVFYKRICEQCSPSMLVVLFSRTLFRRMHITARQVSRPGYSTLLIHNNANDGAPAKFNLHCMRRRKRVPETYWPAGGARHVRELKWCTCLRPTARANHVELQLLHAVQASGV